MCVPIVRFDKRRRGNRWASAVEVQADRGAVATGVQPYEVAHLVHQQQAASSSALGRRWYPSGKVVRELAWVANVADQLPGLGPDPQYGGAAGVGDRVGRHLVHRDLEVDEPFEGESCGVRVLDEELPYGAQVVRTERDERCSRRRVGQRPVELGGEDDRIGVARALARSVGVDDDRVRRVGIDHCGGAQPSRVVRAEDRGRTVCQYDVDQRLVLDTRRVLDVGAFWPDRFTDDPGPLAGVFGEEGVENPRDDAARVATFERHVGEVHAPDVAQLRAEKAQVRPRYGDQDGLAG